MTQFIARKRPLIRSTSYAQPPDGVILRPQQVPRPTAPPVNLALSHSSRSVFPPKKALALAKRHTSHSLNFFLAAASRLTPLSCLRHHCDLFSRRCVLVRAHIHQLPLPLPTQHTALPTPLLHRGLLTLATTTTSRPNQQRSRRYKHHQHRHNRQLRIR